MPFFLGREPPPAPLTTTCQKCFRDAGHRRGRARHLPPDLLRDARQLLVRRSTSRRARSSFAGEFIRERLRARLGPHLGHASTPATPSSSSAPDQVAIDLWEQIGMPPERIVRLPASENFWSVGGPGPCGPDSEIYFDWGEERGCGEADCRPGCTRCERFLEFWNLVFMEYELHAGRDADAAAEAEHRHGPRRRAHRAHRPGRRLGLRHRRLPADHGLDRSAESGVAYGDTPDATKAHRVLADHGRGMTFLVGDGVTPSNEGRGYVLPPRHPPRRAARAADRARRRRSYRPRPASSSSRWATSYPGAGRARDQIERVLGAEEERFARDARARHEALRRGGRRRGDLRRRTRSRSRRRTASRSS